jgi:hypothetical protein
MSIVRVQAIGKAPLELGLMNQAIGFFNGGSRCMADVSITPIVTNSPVSPALVCYAFSVELYLKLLHAINSGAAPRGHELAGLYSSLPIEIKTKLTAIYGADIGAHIESVSSAFTEWRYLHEHEALSINPQILINLAKCCHRVAQQLRPDLRPSAENDID